MNMKVRQTLDCIIQRFKVGDIPKVVAFSMFPAADIPSAKWSTLNRTIMFLSGSQDARGFKQWKEIGRTIKKDSQALYILVPNSVKAVPGNYSYYGYYSSKRKEIGLPTSDEVNFFHELAHCGHEKVVGKWW